MGKPTLTDRDLATAVVQGTFAAVANGAAVSAQGEFNVSLWGTFAATVRPERSFDGGTTWLPLTYLDGAPITWAAPMTSPMPECEGGVLWRLACSAYTSGTVNWRVSQ
jgi:hypothetical protein